MAEANVENTEAFEQVQQLIRSQVEDYLKQQLPVMQQQLRQPQVDPMEAANAEVAKVVNPFIEPRFNEVNIIARNAADKVDFYTDNPRATEFRDEVEHVFNQTLQNGRPMPRRDILRYVMGKEMLDNPEKFEERRAEQLKRAQRAEDLGGSSVGKEKADSVFGNFESLSLEDMEKALDGIPW